MEVIADLAREWGLKCLSLRPKELAGDTTTDFPVMEHAVRWLEFNEDYRALHRSATVLHFAAAPIGIGGREHPNC